MLSWLSKLTASLLVSVLFAAVLTLFLDQTLLNSSYLEGQLASTNSYVKLSDALSDQVVKSSDSNDPALKAKVQSILTPTVLQTKLDSALEQLQAYYKGNGPVPVIDLTDLANQAQANGIKIGDGSGLTKPITISGNSQVKGITNTFRLVKLSTILAVLILTALLLFLSWERHRYAALPDVLISVGALFGLITLLFMFAPGFANSHIKFDSSSNAFASIGHDLALSIVHDLGRRFGIIAVGYLAVGIGTRIWVARMKPKLASAATKNSKSSR